MKNFIKSSKKVSLLVSLIFIVATSDAQIIFDDDVEDVPAAPIDGFIAIGIAAGTYLAFRNKKKIK